MGIRDSSLAEKLQLDPELTLNKTMTLVHQAEAVKQQQPLLRDQNHPAGVKKPDTPVGAVLKGRSGYGRVKGQRPRQRLPKRVVESQPLSAKCSHCGKSPSLDRQQCPAYGGPNGS